VNQRLARVAERRTLLVERAAAQRTALGRAAAPWRARLAVADQGIAAVGYLRRRPGLLVLGALLVLALRPRRVATWLQRGWLVWEIGRRLRGR